MARKSSKSKYSSRKFIQSLLEKGFQEANPAGHRFFVFYYNGIKTSIRTMVSHSEKDFGYSLLKPRKMQLHLHKTKDFEDFHFCPMTKEQYESLLLENKAIRP